MTMPLSISFSRATASAIAINSALLALTAAGAVAIKSFLYSLDGFSAVGAERRGGLNELVGQDELGRRDVGRMDDMFLAGLVGQVHVIVDEPFDRAGELLPSLVRLAERDPRLEAGPVGKVVRTRERTVDARRADLEPVAAVDRVGEVEELGQAVRDALAIGDVELARVGPLGHDLERRVGCSADHHHAPPVRAPRP